MTNNLGDYGTYWNPSTGKGFAWANVDYATDFRIGLHVTGGQGFDEDVDGADRDAFETSASGPAIPVSSGCETRDLDRDRAVNQSDFVVFQRCLSGENAPADPSCAE